MNTNGNNTHTHTTTRGCRNGEWLLYLGHLLEATFISLKKRPTTVRI
jgi:hypothetical protein